MSISLSPFAPEDLASRQGFGSPVPRQRTHLHTRAEFDAYLRDSSRVPRRRPCVCVCVFSSHSFWTPMDVPAGVTQEEGHTGFLIHLLSAVHALMFLARRIQPFLSLVDREVEFCVLKILIVLHPLGIFCFCF